MHISDGGLKVELWLALMPHRKEDPGSSPGCPNPLCPEFAGFMSTKKGGATRS